MIAHNVYFSLKDSSDAAVARLIVECETYLREHPGVAFFACGKLVEDLDRPVNDRDFHVALHVIFEDRASHDVYQAAKAHLEFIDRNKDNWGTVRVFDSSC